MAHQQRLLEQAAVGETELESVRQAEQAIKNHEAANTVMAAPEKEFWLDLLLPEALPAEISLDPSEKTRLHDLLSSLLAALALDHRERLPIIEELLLRAVPTKITPAEVAISGIPLTAFQAIDYDRYFRVNRFASDEPALSMVRGLLQTVLAVTHLFCKAEDLSETRVRQQIDGFSTQTRLLARTFGLEALK